MAASPIYRSVVEYQSGNDPFSSYLERVGLFFTANEVPEAKKVPVFLSVLGSKTYSVLRTLVAPTIPQDKSFADLVSVLKKHFDPKPLVIVERFQFHQHAQNIGESIADYVAELRRFTVHCQYGTHLKEALRDRLVCGIRNERTWKKLLVIDKLTLTRAVEIAQGRGGSEQEC